MVVLIELGVSRLVGRFRVPILKHFRFFGDSLLVGHVQISWETSGAYFERFPDTLDKKKNVFLHGCFRFFSDDIWV